MVPSQGDIDVTQAVAPPSVLRPAALAGAVIRPRHIQLHLPMANGKQTGTTNMMEAVRYGLQWETTDEFLRIERHQLLGGAWAIIPLSGCDDAIAVHADEAGIGDGDAIGVATHIRQYLPRSCMAARQFEPCIWVGGSTRTYLAHFPGRLGLAFRVRSSPMRSGPSAASS